MEKQKLSLAKMLQQRSETTPLLSFFYALYSLPKLFKRHQCCLQPHSDILQSTCILAFLPYKMYNKNINQS